jgi:hypothetical protein
MSIESIIQNLKFPSFSDDYELSKSCVQCSDEPYLSFHNFGDRGAWLSNIFAITCPAFPESKYLTIDIREHLSRDEVCSMGVSSTTRLKLVPEALYHQHGDGISLLLALSQKSKVVVSDNIQFNDDIPFDVSDHSDCASDLYNGLKPYDYWLVSLGQTFQDCRWPRGKYFMRRFRAEMGSGKY